MLYFYRLRILKSTIIYFLICTTIWPASASDTLNLEQLNLAAIEQIKHGKNLETINLLTKNISIYETNRENEPYSAAIYNLILAQAYKDLNDPENCIHVSEAGKNIIVENNLQDSMPSDYLYFLEHLSQEYSRTNDLYKSNLYCSEGLEFNQRSVLDLTAKLSFTSTAAINWSLMGKHKKSIFYYESALNILSKLPTRFHYNKPYILQNISQSYKFLNQIDSSIIFLEESIRLQEADPEQFERDFFSLYATAANRCLQAGKIEKANDYFNLAEKHFQENAPITEIAHFYQIRGKFHQESSRYKQAAEDFILAKTKLSLPEKDSPMHTFYPREYLSVLASELELKETLFHSSDSSEHLWEYCMASLKTLEESKNIILRLPSDALKNVVLQHVKVIYRHVLNAAFLSMNQGYAYITRKDMIRTFESYQAQLINHESLRDQWLTNSTSSAQLSRHRHLIHQYDSLFYASAQLTFDDDIQSAYGITTHALYQLEDSIRESILVLRNDFPAFDGIMTQQDEIDESDLDIVFEQSPSILQYFHLDDELFSCHLTRDDLELIKINYTDSIQIILNHWITQISQTSPTSQQGAFKKEINKSQLNGQYLYQFLMETFNSKLNKSVLIIPDGDITNIPFCALNKTVPHEPTDYHAANYLLETHYFTSHFSLKLAAQMIQQENESTFTASTFSPNQSSLTLADPLSGQSFFLPALPFSQNESDLTVTLFDARHIDPSQKNEVIISKMRNSRLLHIGSHVVLNDEFPDQSYIPLQSDGSELINIKPYELFSEPLSNDIVIVNACHSGAGKSRIGRGMVSFVSGFVLADAKSILSSRWAVQDKPGFDLMSNIFHGLKANRTISESMHDAQLARLQSNDPVLSHPAYWASYYLIGDQTTALSQSVPMYVWLLTLIAIAILAFVIYKIYAQRKK